MFSSHTCLTSQGKGLPSANCPFYVNIVYLPAGKKEVKRVNRKMKDSTDTQGDDDQFIDRNNSNVNDSEGVGDRKDLHHDFTSSQHEQANLQNKQVQDEDCKDEQQTQQLQQQQQQQQLPSQETENTNGNEQHHPSDNGKGSPQKTSTPGSSTDKNDHEVSLLELLLSFFHRKR